MLSTIPTTVSIVRDTRKMLRDIASLSFLHKTGWFFSTRCLNLKRWCLEDQLAVLVPLDAELVPESGESTRPLPAHPRTIIHRGARATSPFFSPCSATWYNGPITGFKFAMMKVI